MKPDTELLTLAEAATVTGLSAATLRVQANRGRLLAVKRGRDWWVTRKELHRYMATVARVSA